jgi:hypothetical protein
MSDNTTHTDVTEAPAPAADAQPAPADTADTTDTEDTSSETEVADQDAAGPGKEAARYRRRLRDTETQRDQLAQRLEAMQRAAIDAQADREKIKPAALWASGVELAALLTDDGTVDTSKVTEAITAARATLGIEKPPPRNHVAREGSNPRPATASSGLAGMIQTVMGGRE